MIGIVALIDFRLGKKNNFFRDGSDNKHLYTRLSYLINYINYLARNVDVDVFTYYGSYLRST